MTALGEASFKTVVTFFPLPFWPSHSLTSWGNVNGESTQFVFFPSPFWMVLYDERVVRL